MSEEKRFALALETFSCHLAFSAGRMDIPGFVTRCAELGLDGVQLNMGHLAPYLKGNPAGARELRELTKGFGMFVEVDTWGTEPRHLTVMLNLCKSIGADVLRTYASDGLLRPSWEAGAGTDVSRSYARVRRELTNKLEQAPQQLRAVVPLCQQLGVRIAVENHEYEASRDILNIVRQVDSPWIGTHIDNGNGMMVWEEPVDAVRAMAPYAVTTHFKDHVVVVDDGQPLVVGVTLGTGSAHCAECFRILAEESPLRRLSIEVCYAYFAPFRCPQDRGCGGRLGEGAFRVVDPPFDPAWIALYPTKTGGQDLDRLIAWQEDSVSQSVAYVKNLNNSYHSAMPRP